MVGELHGQARRQQEAGDLGGFRIREDREVLVDGARAPGLETDLVGLGLDVDAEGKGARRADAG
jgi:hypothetical protein